MSSSNSGGKIVAMMRAAKPWYRYNSYAAPRQNSVWRKPILIFSSVVDLCNGQSTPEPQGSTRIGGVHGTRFNQKHLFSLHFNSFP
jgi:hypothetical protein